MASMADAKGDGGDVRGRVIVLEGRVDHLEVRVEGIERSLGAAAPEETEDTAPAASPGGPRCPGCRLEIASLSAERCEWCGFVLSVTR